MTVTIAVASCRRPEGLARLLRALSALDAASGHAGIVPDVVVVDNDAGRSAAPVCDALRAAMPWPLHYVHEPRPGIAFARNAAVRDALARGAEAVAFVDDDEVPEPAWLSHLITVQRQYGADIVFGPVVRRFDGHVPEWVTRGRFFERPRYATGARVAAAGAGNVLVCAGVFRGMPRLFDERIGLGSGEDEEFFTRAGRTGYTLVWSDEAIVHELVPPTRATARWLLHRAFSHGNTTRWLHQEHQSALARVGGVAVALGGLIRGLVVGALVSPIRRDTCVRHLQAVSYHLGYLVAITGRRYEEYRAHHVRSPRHIRPAARPARLRRVAIQGLRVLPITAYQRLIPRPVIGLCYHIVSDRMLPHIRHLYPYKSPRQFECDLEYLQQRYDLVSYQTLRQGTDAGRTGVRPAAVLTFDDGLKECFSIARPLLLRRRIPCIFFISPPFLDNERLFHFNKVSLCLDALTQLGTEGARAYLREFERLTDVPLADVPSFRAWLLRWIQTSQPDDEWVLDHMCHRVGVDLGAYLHSARPYMTAAEVQALSADGFTIGAHGMRHTALGALDDRQQVATEIVDSCRAVMTLTGHASVPFAFPFDGVGLDRDWLAELAAHHPEVGLFFDTRQLQRAGRLVVNRLIADRPPAIFPDRTNLPGLLRNAYLDELLCGCRRRSTERGAVPAPVSL